MSHKDVDDYFAEIVAWMKNDVRREIELARLTDDGVGRKVLVALDIAGGGNLLAALGLVAYTEALGQLRVWNRTQPHRYGGSEESFLAFFDEMDGGSYKAFRNRWEGANQGKTIYEVLRCGLVHEYRPKVDSEFWIGQRHVLGLDEGDGRLIFKVEPYYRHLCAEADRLHQELKQLPNPEIPSPRPPLKAAPKQPPPSPAVGSGPRYPPTAPSVRPTS